MSSQILYAIWRMISVTRDVDMGESYQIRRVLCAYAAKYADPAYELPQEVIDNAAEHLTEAEQADLTVLGEIRAEFSSFNQALENEFAAMDPKAKAILLANAEAGIAAAEPFSKNMDLLQRLLWGALTSAATGWDMYLGFTGPDQSLLPRSSGYAITTISGAIGFLASPTANRMQFLETVFMDRAVFGTPHRSFYTAGSEYDSFYKNKIPYLTGVSVAAATIVLGWTLPPAIKKKVDDRTMSKIGATVVQDEQRIMHDAMKVSAKAKAEKLRELEAKLERISSKWLPGDGTEDQITRIRSQTNRQADLLLRITGQYVEKKHAEHWKKARYIGLWNSTIGGILYAARGNLGQIGVLVPYIVHAERCMWEVFFDFTQGAEAMRKVYVRLGAPIFYQLWCISVPLLKRGSHAFNDAKLKEVITALLVTINATVIRHTPYIVDGIAAFGGWLLRCGRKPAAAVSAGADDENQEGKTVMSTSSAAPDLVSGMPEEDEVEAAMLATPAALELVCGMFEDENFDIYVGDGQYLKGLSGYDETDFHF